MEMKYDVGGHPFKSEDAARKDMRAKNLSDDVWGVSKVPGGYALERYVDMVERERSAATKRDEEAKASAAKAEKFWRVKFSARQEEGDAEFVELSCNGEPLTIRRETEVVVPERFLNVADCAVERVFAPTANEAVPYREAGRKMRRPYMRIAEATREEYEKMLAAGNDVTHKEILARRDAGVSAAS